MTENVKKKKLKYLFREEATSAFASFHALKILNLMMCGIIVIIAHYQCNCHSVLSPLMDQVDHKGKNYYVNVFTMKTHHTLFHLSPFKSF